MYLFSSLPLPVSRSLSLSLCLCLSFCLPLSLCPSSSSLSPSIYVSLSMSPSLSPILYPSILPLPICLYLYISLFSYALTCSAGLCFLPSSILPSFCSQIKRTQERTDGRAALCQSDASTDWTVSMIGIG